MFKNLFNILEYLYTIIGLAVVSDITQAFVPEGLKYVYKLPSASNNPRIKWDIKCLGNLGIVLV